MAMTDHYIDVPAFLGAPARRSPGGEFAGVPDQLLLDGLTLGALPDRPEFVFNATNLNAGVLWRFSKGFVGDYVTGGGPDPATRVSTAVAASSAFPPFFAPLTFRRSGAAGRTSATAASTTTSASRRPGSGSGRSS